MDRIAPTACAQCGRSIDFSTHIPGNPFRLASWHEFVPVVAAPAAPARKVRGTAVIVLVVIIAMALVIWL